MKQETIIKRLSSALRDVVKWYPYVPADNSEQSNGDHMEEK